MDLDALARTSSDPYVGDPSYFEMAEQHMARQWVYYVRPVLARLPRLATVVDLGCGYGRNLEYLRREVSLAVGVDANIDALDYCRRRFAGKEDVILQHVDGHSLPGVNDGSVSLVYSFDSMVHFAPEVVDAYLRETARVLAPGGHAFLHHSNRACPEGADFKAQPHWRNNMTREWFAALARRAGLAVLEQRVIGWDESLPEGTGGPGYAPELDCLSLLQKPGVGS
jgi:SAM-dependent methyltransferase